RVLAEYDLTRRLVLSVTEHDRLVATRPVLSRAIVLRDPYVDALSYLQLRALSALRAEEATESERPVLDRMLLLTVSGIAAGLQNTGWLRRAAGRGLTASAPGSEVLPLIREAAWSFPSPQGRRISTWPDTRTGRPRCQQAGMTALPWCDYVSF